MEAGHGDLEAALPNGQARRGPWDQSVAEDRSNSKDLWVPPAGRESALEVVRSGFSFDLRAYKGDPKPSKLFPEEEEEEARYKIPPGDVPPEPAEALEGERQRVIRSQAVRRSNTVAERWGSPERPPRGRETPEAGQGGPAEPCRKEPSAPQNVDTDQICFAAARDQFLTLEKAHPKALLRGPRSAESGGVPGGEGTPRALKQRGTPNHEGPGGPRERTEQALGSSGPPLPGPDAVGGDLARGEQPGGRRREPLSLPDGPPDPETPVEREIRLSQAGEQAHRRERGLASGGPDPREELVAIRARPLLAAAVASWPAASGTGKPTVSFCIQREAAQQETGREAARRSEGRLPFACPQLAERRKVFEAEVPTPTLSPGRSTEPVGPGSPATGGSVPDGRGSPGPDEPSSGPPEEAEARSHHSSDPPRSWMDRPGTETLAGAHPGSTSRARGGPKSPREDGEQAPPEGARGDERYTLRTWRPRTSALIDREIQEALEREVELQEQRRKVSRGSSDVPFSSQSSGASGVAGNYSVSSSPVFSPASPPLGRAFLGSVSGESGLRGVQSPPVRRREDGKYAGIELADEIDTEVVMSTKAVCRRGILAQRWESGQIRRVEDEDGD